MKLRFRERARAAEIREVVNGSLVCELLLGGHTIAFLRERAALTLFWRTVEAIWTAYAFGERKAVRS